MKIKYIQISLLTSVVLYGHSVQANKIPEELRDFNHRTYNALPLSGEADLELKKNGNLNKFLEDVAPVVEKYDFGHSIGFRLLHRHETLEEGQVMVENFDHWKGVPALITTLENKDTPKIYPASWSCGSSGLTVFEYSKDSRAKKVAKKLGANPAFLGEIKDLLIENKLEHILAPAILTRENFVHFNATQPLYELIRPAPYASILVNKSLEEIRAVSEAGGNLVRTTWPVGNNNKYEVLCVTHCSTSEDDYRFHEYEHD